MDVGSARVQAVFFDDGVTVTVYRVAINVLKSSWRQERLRDMSTRPLPANAFLSRTGEPTITWRFSNNAFLVALFPIYIWSCVESILKPYIAYRLQRSETITRRYLTLPSRLTDKWPEYKSSRSATTWTGIDLRTASTLIPTLYATLKHPGIQKHCAASVMSCLPQDTAFQE